MIGQKDEDFLKLLISLGGYCTVDHAEELKLAETGFLLLWLGSNLRLFRSRQDVLTENLTLRQQLSVFKRRNRRPKLAVLDKLFWVLARRFWCDWKKSLLVVAPETVVR